MFLEQFSKHGLTEHDVIPFLKQDVNLPKETTTDDYGKLINTLVFSTYLGIELPHQVNLELIKLLENSVYLDRFNERNSHSEVKISHGKFHKL